VKRGLFVAPFDELVDPELLANLARRAEDLGWEGFFLWDHVAYPAPVSAVADPWVAMSAIAIATSTIRIGPLVTPLPRRRIHKLARETATLDRLSHGRLVLGVGIGSERTGELERFGEVLDARERARLLDAGLDRLTELWAGEFQPPPVQQPRIPIWVAARWPNRRPVRRAARWDGLFPIELPGPDQLAELVEEVSRERAESAPFEFVVTLAPGEDLGPWARAGATWALTGFGSQPREPEVRAAIEAGPRWAAGRRGPRRW
jgi:alkanesulfonate monooxygenase SsuD/methylene tetrahydromethanopterin reductase-like flavin-dependent oxidoreductase (luciferase family)